MPAVLWVSSAAAIDHATKRAAARTVRRTDASMMAAGIGGTGADEAAAPTLPGLDGYATRRADADEAGGRQVRSPGPGRRASCTAARSSGVL
jgi:hypothetical protein